VVVVHGTPWSSFNLRRLIVPLSKDFTVYYYDLVGYGTSDKSPGEFSLGIPNQILDQLLGHLNPKDPVVVGHGFGDMMVQKKILTRCLEKNNK
jgi:pimeloyl-ACP methyl ester carboxylesterase